MKLMNSPENQLLKTKINGFELIKMEKTVSSLSSENKRVYRVI